MAPCLSAWIFRPLLPLGCCLVPGDLEAGEGDCIVDTARPAWPAQATCRGDRLFSTRSSPGWFVLQYLFLKSPCTIYFLVPPIGKNSATMQHPKKKTKLFPPKVTIPLPGLPG